MQTKIMEMGQPPPVQKDEPAMWVKSRQFTGRIVTVTNDKVFSEPVYNYTDQFPYVWDEISIPLHFTDDRDRAEAVMLSAARRHALSDSKLGETEVNRLESRYGIRIGEIDARLYVRIADGWPELTVRFLAPDHGVREIKDAVTREILAEFDKAGIEIASSSYEITAVPPIQIAKGRHEKV
jgi:small-conductance mechanosensitive channel